MPTTEDFKGTLCEADYLYQYRTLLINIPKHFVFVIYLLYITVLSKLKTVPWGLDFKWDEQL